MAITGVKKSFYAKYAFDESGKTYGYSGGGAFARLVDITVTPESNNAELYSDNELEESDYTFVKGTLKVTSSGIESSVTADIMGITADESGELVYGDNLQNEVGFGFIITKKKKGSEAFRAIILPRVKFKLKEDTAATRAGTMTFQNETIEGTISRDHSETHVWKRENTFNTEAEAVSYIKTFLNIK